VLEPVPAPQALYEPPPEAAVQLGLF
jgi:hypothetical protein